ncbi:hypothetical protein [Inconstantimicrobium mannanitabidum]|uniref:Uncharacterized protein n=1 Tax=Inconstantimicrobium mannanitabidum TaxID=1604901 RepID=A0ACB5RGW7_9CLOT|nr:hypothetical protein [Clostridium sp. TW13]GKX68336.1 hypothetical protein rsdtw13_35940 [Clostridium sp. TW13]
MKKRLIITICTLIVLIAALIAAFKITNIIRNKNTNKNDVFSTKANSKNAKIIGNISETEKEKVIKLTEKVANLTMNLNYNNFTLELHDKVLNDYCRLEHHVSNEEIARDIDSYKKDKQIDTLQSIDIQTLTKTPENFIDVKLSVKIHITYDSNRKERIVTYHQNYVFNKDNMICKARLDD